MAGPMLVAVINSSEEVVEVIRDTLEDMGFRTCGAHIHDFRTGKADLDRYLLENDPRVVVWDIAPPYDENWSYFQQIRTRESARDRRFVITTTNLDRLIAAAGPREAIEIVGKPFDAERIVEAICRVEPDAAPCDQRR